MVDQGRGGHPRSEDGRLSRKLRQLIFRPWAKGRPRSMPMRVEHVLSDGRASSENPGAGLISLQSLLAGALLAAVLANVSQFIHIEERVGRNWKALYRWQVDPLQEVGSMRRRYGIFIHIARVSDGTTMLVPAQRNASAFFSPQFRQWLYGIGRVNAIRQLDSAPEVDPEALGLTRHLAAEGEFHGTPFRIYAEEGAEELLFTVSPEGRIAIIETGLLPERLSDAIK